MSLSLFPVRESVKGGRPQWETVFESSETQCFLFEPDNSVQDVNNPPPNPSYRPELDMNLTHRNMRDVLNAVGYELDEDGLLVDIQQFIRAVTLWRTTNLTTESPGLDASILKAPGRAAVIDCGRRPGYINDKIQQAGQIAVEGRQRGATHICVA